jgi:nitroreductase/NAD-dependent dihydropyrimidine dehydrogenase PreA subunit
MTTLLSIDESICTYCGECAAACPMGLVTVENCLPKTPNDAAERCVLCGHCIAACPELSLNHAGLDAEDGFPLLADWRSTPQMVEQLIKGRRSIRRYRPDAVEKSTLLEILDIARYAPTGVNSQTVEWLVIYDREEVKKLAGSVIEWMRELGEKNQLIGGRYDPSLLVAAWEGGYDPILRGCPHVIIAHGSEKDHFAPSSCTIALTTVELAALPFELGTCWAGFLHLAARSSSKVHESLGLPTGNIMHGGLMIGYPQESYHSIPPRKPLNISWRW